MAMVLGMGAVGETVAGEGGPPLFPSDARAAAASRAAGRRPLREAMS